MYKYIYYHISDKIKWFLKKLAQIKKVKLATNTKKHILKTYKLKNRLTLSANKLRGGALYALLSHNPYWIWYQTISLYTHSLPLNFLIAFSVLRVQGLKRASKFPSNELHALFTLF